MADNQAPRKKMSAGLGVIWWFCGEMYEVQQVTKCICLIIREIYLNGVLDIVKVTANELMEQIRPAKWLAERWGKMG